jgi:MFS transporter, DHA1 family, multidrug resistance protein
VLLVNPSKSAISKRGTTSRSYGETIVFLALTQAMAALAIDLILPAFPEIRAHLGLPADSTRVSLLITAFFIGSGVAQLFTGILADRFGRKPVLWGGLIIYVVAGLAATFAPTLPVMIACRVLWGIGSSAPRVVGLAMVRDQFEGARMAQTLSYVQAIFVVVPVVAPTIGKGVLALSNWHVAMAAPAVLALILAVWIFRIPESLPAEKRRVINGSTIVAAFREVARTRQTVLLGVAITCGFGALNSYIALAEVIADKTYGQKDSFPFVFGVIALTMGLSGFVNGRIVGRFGTTTMIKASPPVLVGVAAVFAGGTALANGKPAYLFYCVCMAAFLAAQTLIFPNINSLALQPLGHIAGLASGLIGTISTIVGSALGVVVSQSHGYGTTALSSGLLVLSTVALVASRLAVRPIVRAAER